MFTKAAAACATVALIALPCGAASAQAQQRTAQQGSLAEMATARALPFERLDLNKNGQLEDVELPNALNAALPRADKDNSGGLSPAELDAEFKRLEARLARGPALDPNAPIRDWKQLKAALDKFTAHHELDGAVLMIGRGERVFFEGYAGSYNADTLLNMASASKWPGGAAVAAAVAEGKLDPKAPLSSWKPKWASDPKGALTLERLMSFTTGAAGIESGTPDIALDPRMDMQRAADILLERPLVTPTNTQFAYGGWTQQVGAAWAASATNEPFTKLWGRTVQGPARMTDSHFGHPRKSRDGLDLSNPNLQAGLWTTPRDFSRFLMMMHTGGKVGGKQVYPAAAIKLIEHDYANGLPHRWQGAGAEGGRSYGWALWCEKVAADLSCPMISSGGAWGTMPWIDREKDLWGLFMVFDRGPRVRPDLTVLRRAGEEIALKQAR